MGCPHHIPPLKAWDLCWGGMKSRGSGWCGEKWFPAQQGRWACELRDFDSLHKTYTCSNRKIPRPRGGRWAQSLSPSWGATGIDNGLGEGKHGFLQWSKTWSTDHTPGQASHPGVSGQYKLDLVGFFFLGVGLSEKEREYDVGWSGRWGGPGRNWG